MFPALLRRVQRQELYLAGRNPGFPHIRTPPARESDGGEKMEVRPKIASLHNFEQPIPGAVASNIFLRKKKVCIFTE
jgi:hypothetical protein